MQDLLISIQIEQSLTRVESISIQIQRDAHQRFRRTHATVTLGSCNYKTLLRSVNFHTNRTKSETRRVNFYTAEHIIFMLNERNLTSVESISTQIQSDVHQRFRRTHATVTLGSCKEYNHAGLVNFHTNRTKSDTC